MRILITGASGFVGSYLIRHLLAAQPEADIMGTVLSGHPLPSAPDPHVRFVACDITANGGVEIEALVRQFEPAHLYHLAGVASAASEDRDAMFQANVDGTRFVMEAATRQPYNTRVLFVSTGYVYGPCDPARPAREEDRPAPPGLYGVYADSKRAAEAPAHAGGAIIARAFNHTGPGQTDAFAVPAFAKQIAAIEKGKQPRQIQVGNLEAHRDFLDVRDVVCAYRLLMEQGTLGEIYNVCCGHALQMSAVLDSLLALSSQSIAVVPDPSRTRPSDLPFSVGDPAKLKGVTGWQPRIPFGQTLRDTLNWWREQ